ncbi:hypothetical protein EDB89DRAFT_2067014 [Lactarius sanguifluus]|nr:hypothetical protein EDB89DRAFT_2067014 [Lactarius sanguifluus]
MKTPIPFNVPNTRHRAMYRTPDTAQCTEHKNPEELERMYSLEDTDQYVLFPAVEGMAVDPEVYDPKLMAEEVAEWKEWCKREEAARLASIKLYAEHRAAAEAREKSLPVREPRPLFACGGVEFPQTFDELEPSHDVWDSSDEEEVAARSAAPERTVQIELWSRQVAHTETCTWRQKLEEQLSAEGTPSPAMALQVKKHGWSEEADKEEEDLRVLKRPRRQVAWHMMPPHEPLAFQCRPLPPLERPNKTLVGAIFNAVALDIKHPIAPEHLPLLRTVEQEEKKQKVREFLAQMDTLACDGPQTGPDSEHHPSGAPGCVPGTTKEDTPTTQIPDPAPTQHQPPPTVPEAQQGHQADGTERPH